MNVDIINALSNAYKICDVITKSNLLDNYEDSIKEILNCDLINFIKFISIHNTEERIYNFSKEYLNNMNIKDIKINSPINSMSLPLFLLVDSKTNSNTSKLIVQLFITVGKHFVFSKYDKKDINRDMYTDYILEMNNYIDTYTKKRKIEVPNTEEHTLTKTNETKTSDNHETKNTDENEDKTLQELLNDLNSLIGLEKVKKEVKKRINQIQVDKRREKAGFKKSSMSLHLVFTGNPGTGKTTVARKLAAIYKELGVLSQGQLIEVDRSGLVGGYVGSTAIKTQEVIDKAMGGILFIDETYTLTYGKGDNDFGQEAIDTLLKAMEDKRDDFVVIVAGYTKEMNEFINSNPGLESRFNKYIEFDDYTSDELLQIFRLTCKNDDKYIHEECDEYLVKYFEEMVASKTSNFANGRTVRNYYEKVIENLNERLIENLDHISDEELQLIRLSDLHIEV